jgi:hypothetical protein
MKSQGHADNRHIHGLLYVLRHCHCIGLLKIFNVTRPVTAQVVRSLLLFVYSNKLDFHYHGTNPVGHALDRAVFVRFESLSVATACWSGLLSILIDSWQQEMP